MGYLFIFFAVFCNMTKGYASKRVSGSLSSVRESIAFNIVRSFVCCSFAFMLVLIKRIPGVFTISTVEIAICMAAGISMAVFTAAWILALKTDAYMFVSACGSASFIIPFLCGLIFWNEDFTPFKLMSFVLILLALYFLLRYNFKLNGSLSMGQVLLLLLIVISQGITQTTQKMYAMYADKDISCYTLYMFIIAFFFFILIFPFFKKDSKEKEHFMIKGNTKYVLIMGLALFATSYFQTCAAKEVDAIILYPLLNALNLIGGSSMASLIFREKMSRDSVIGIVLVFGALLFSKF